MRWSRLLSQCVRMGLVLAWSLLAGIVAAQTELLPVPARTAYVVDQTHTLDDLQRKALDDKLATFEAIHGSQVVVLVVQTTAPEDIASFANRVGNTWKIGRKEVGDGLLLVVAKDDRKVRIEVPKTLEGAIPDLASKQVIAQAIAPRFKQGDFAGGLDAGVENIMALIRHEALPDPTAVEPETYPTVPDDWIAVAVVDLAILVVFVAAAGWSGALIVLICSTVGAFVGAMAWLSTGSGSALTGWAMGSSFFTFLVVMELRKPRQGNFSVVSTAPNRKDTSDSSDTNGWSSSDSSSSSGSSDSGVSSGGGGDFGGGGASGEW